MSVPLHKWVETVEKTFKGMSADQRMSRAFMRDPMRLTTIDSTKFFSPADGLIIYQKKVKHGDVVDIKGKAYTLSDVLEKPHFDKPCLVIGIFMTVYDVHVNRIPYGGVLKFQSCTPITSNNIPMDLVQNDEMRGQIGKIIPDMSYAKLNARVVNEIYSTSLDYRYYVTQIADDEVNVISHFTMEQNTWFNQNQRFSFVRWGSQVELVLPLDDRYTFKTLVPDYFHVRGGIDALVKIV